MTIVVKLCNCQVQNYVCKYLLLVKPKGNSCCLPWTVPALANLVPWVRFQDEPLVQFSKWQHRGSMVSTDASLQEDLSDPGVVLCSPCACVGIFQVLPFPSQTKNMHYCLQAQSMGFVW